MLSALILLLLWAAAIALLLAAMIVWSRHLHPARNFGVKQKGER